ncbi:hypothetical protein SASPL_126457 [Salvia splendens]|uniref:BED-type domain-containing protein n=1 Tax=Salvia splendens TaxID=180675 RepID=A0A8X8ZR10_SALSN|nr:hypothetical protein SASPL_126457 [Salvia splendens]
MEFESSHPLSNSPASEPPKTLDNPKNDDGTSRKRAIEDSIEKPPLPPKRKGGSPYWDHCVKVTRKLSNGTTQQIGICIYCKTEIPAVSGSTSGLKNHLVKRCKKCPLYDGSCEKGQTMLTNETMGQRSQIVAHTFNQKKCELKLTEYVIIDEVSFRAVEGKGFVALLHEAQPRFRIPDRKKVAGMVYTLCCMKHNRDFEFLTERKLQFSSVSTVPMDVKTRWNSTYKMLDSALKYRRVFERMAEEWVPFMKYFREKDEKGKERMGPPIAEDWENAKAFVHFLKNFYDATLELSA